MVYEKAYISNDPDPHDNETGLAAMAGDGGYKLGTLHGVIRDRKSTRLNSSH